MKLLLKFYGHDNDVTKIQIKKHSNNFILSSFHIKLN